MEFILHFISFGLLLDLGMKFVVNHFFLNFLFVCMHFILKIISLHITIYVQVISSPHDWLDPSIQLNVPLVDVDKVYLFSCFRNKFFEMSYFF